MEDNEISVFDRPRQTRRKRETRNSSDIFLVKSPGTKGTSLFSYNHLSACPNRISRSKSVAYASFSFAVLLHAHASQRKSIVSSGCTCRCSYSFQPQRRPAFPGRRTLAHCRRPPSTRSMHNSPNMRQLCLWR
jgi:hypothetical protein